MNLMGYIKIIIPVIILIIIISGIAIGLDQGNFDIDKQKELNSIETEWRKSGPFSIEKHEYYLGEKIFINVNAIPKDVIGEMIFFRPTTETSIKNIDELKGISEELIREKVKYLGVKFDGKNKQNFNRYFEPRFNEWMGICSTNDLVGEWLIVFSGTQYEKMYFTVIDQKMPGDTRDFEPLVGIGKC
jgi:hypothetical protein